MTNSMTFSDALCEVRKAHRLLWSFYDRLIPACKSLMEEFEPAIFYYSSYGSLGNYSTNPLYRASHLSALPFMSMDVLYGYDLERAKWYDNPQTGDYLLILSLVLDSAFRKYNFSNAFDESGMESEHFPSPEESETKIFLSTVLCCRDIQNKPVNWHAHVYNSFVQHHFTTPLYFDPPAYLNLNGSEGTNEDTDFIAFSKEFDIEKDFASPQAIKQAAENYRSAITEKFPQWFAWSK